MALTDRERAEKLAERLAGEPYPGRGFDASAYGPNSDHLPHGAQLGPVMVSMPPTHPSTPDQSPAPTTPAMWNAKINKASTVSTIGGECHSLLLHRVKFGDVFPYMCCHIRKTANLIFQS